MKSLEQLAKEDFESYRGSHPRGHDIPKWEQLSECVKASWIVRDKAIPEASEKKDKRQNLLAGVGEAYAPSDKSEMLDTARVELEMLREALGVSVEPRQTLFDRMIEAAEGRRADALDAQRYRWLRAQPLESDMFCTTIWRKGSDGFGDDLRLEELDAAIDAAIAASKEKAK